MTRYIALLRAINVGGHTVKMDDLRRQFESLGFAGVATYIQTGNVIFDAPGPPGELELRIEAHLHQALGYPVATFLRTPPEIAAAARRQPFPEPDSAGGALYVAFLKAAPPAERQRALLALGNPVDDFRIHGREVFWLRRTSQRESTFSGALLERTLGAQATVRNVTTVRKLAAKSPPDDAP